jgi:transposase
VAPRIIVPNPDNASLAELYAAQRAGKNSETYRRCTVIILLCTGSTRQQTMDAFNLSDSAIRKKIVRAFNLYGIDGLIAKKRSGRKHLISEEQKEEIIEEFEEPGRAQRDFWTATTFHGHITKKYQMECSYETVRRLLHEKGYVLKVPQPPQRYNKFYRPRP